MGVFFLWEKFQVLGGFLHVDFCFHFLFIKIYDCAIVNEIFQKFWYFYLFIIIIFFLFGNL